jgi:secondary thiamine-phosphate synthase enzyme
MFDRIELRPLITKVDMILHKTVGFDTEPDVLYDLTNKITGFLGEIAAQSGTVTIFAAGSTCGITSIEFEPGLKRDFPEVLEKIAPKGKYRHDATWGDGNGHSHIRSALVGTSFVVPVIAGRLCNGVWQQIVFCEFDNRPRKREVIFTFMGE